MGSSDSRANIACIGGAAVLVAVVALLFGDTPAKVVGVITALAILQGLWRGAAEGVFVLGATIAALVLAPSLGRAIEGSVASLLGTRGLMNRFIAIALVAAFIILGVSAVSALGARRILRRWPGVKPWNRYAGAAVGLVQGLLLSLIVLWIPLALEPVARARDDRERYAVDVQYDAPPPNEPARGIIRYADEVRASALGGIAQATNPAKESRILAVAADFAAVSRDPAAMEHFLESPAVRAVLALPSVEQALARLRSEKELQIDPERGVSAATIMRLLQSDALLDVLDRTTVLSDLRPHADDLIAAVAEAKSRIARRRRGASAAPTRIARPPGAGRTRMLRDSREVRGRM